MQLKLKTKKSDKKRPEKNANVIKMEILKKKRNIAEENENFRKIKKYQKRKNIKKISSQKKMKVSEKETFTL